MAFPGLRRGEALTRRVELPERARDPVGGRQGAGGGTGRRAASSPLARWRPRSRARWHPATTGRVRRGLYARGFPADTPVGSSGLERAFQRRVEGVPGGTPAGGVAGAGALRRRAPAPPARSTIDTRLQEAAVSALAGRLGGIAALDTAHRADPGARRHRVLGTPAAGLDVQDRDHDRRARGEAGQARRPVPRGDPRADRRRRARERQRRAVRRHLRQQLRPVVQLGVRAARREGGRQAAGRDRRALRLESAGRAGRRAAQHPARRRRDRDPAGARLHGDRPGQGAGHRRCRWPRVAQTVANDGVRVLPTLLPARRAPDAYA